MKRIHFVWVSFLLYALSVNIPALSAKEPERVILFMIDGMHW
jgi:hypothetical protein